MSVLRAEVEALFVLVAEFITEQRAANALILARIESKSPAGGPLTRRDRELLAILLPALSGHFGSSVFLASEVFEAPSLARLVDGFSAKQLGKLFSRATGVVFGRLLLERADSEDDCVLWAVKEVIV